RADLDRRGEHLVVVGEVGGDRRRLCVQAEGGQPLPGGATHVSRSSAQVLGAAAPGPVGLECALELAVLPDPGVTEDGGGGQRVAHLGSPSRWPRGCAGWARGVARWRAQRGAAGIRRRPAWCSRSRTARAELKVYRCTPGAPASRTACTRSTEARRPSW